MKKWIMLPVLALGLLATSITAQAKDDLFPWPWGTECPFPWQEIEGSYLVHGPKGGPYNRHVVSFEVIEQQQSGKKHLLVKQFDRRGYMVASGKAYSQKDQRIVRGILKSEETGRNYVVMVRTYAKGDNKSCRSADLATAITFCPLRGKKCMEDSNYVLELLGD
jgi:hypothetical protein